MSFRLWYPQLDVYDAIRRFSAIINQWKWCTLSQERLYIMDFYFANPPLLYDTRMPAEIRTEFNKLSITRSQNTFLSYPAAPILFHKMETVQKEALQNMIGKGLIDSQELSEAGIVKSSEAGQQIFESKLSKLLNERDKSVLAFLVNHFGCIGENDIGVLRRNTGLRRI